MNKLRSLLFFTRPKIFCIGANKTGTSSVSEIFRTLGLMVGRQARAELFLQDWARRDFRRLIAYCRWAEAFQDAPFSFPETYMALDNAYPSSKFILTVRSSSEDWYQSLIRYHTRIVGKQRIPTADDLRQYDYRYPGFLWDVQQLRYGADEKSLYDRDLYIESYETHNSNVADYFRDRPSDLLVLNVAAPDAACRLLAFLGYKDVKITMPHLNAS